MAFAQSMELAVLATSLWTNFAYGYTLSEYSGWEYALQHGKDVTVELVLNPWWLNTAWGVT